MQGYKVKKKNSNCTPLYPQFQNSVGTLLKKTDQILVTVSDRAGQTFEHDMEESDAPKKKKEKKKFVYMYLPTLVLIIKP